MLYGLLLFVLLCMVLNVQAQCSCENAIPRGDPGKWGDKGELRGKCTVSESDHSRFELVSFNTKEGDTAIAFVNYECYNATGSLVTEKNRTKVQRGRDFTIDRVDIEHGTDLTCRVSGCYYFHGSENICYLFDPDPTICNITAPTVTLAFEGDVLPQELNEGNDLNITVIIDDFTLPITNILWTKLGGTLSNNQSKANILTDVSMQTAPVSSTVQLLSSVVPMDSGSYSVTAVNAAGNDTFIFNLRVTAAVNLTYPLDDVMIMEDEGNSIALRCIAKGYPEPSITWFNPDGNKIYINSTIEEDENGFISVMSSLNISNLQRDDSGRYTCSASNIVMDDIVVVNRTSILTVTYIPIFINDSELSISVVMPRSVFFSCTAEGNPAPNIRWIRSGGEIFEESMNVNESIIVTNTITGMMVESTLTINLSVVLDSSTYICVASNNVGSANRTAAVLTVEAIPIFIHDSEPSVSVVMPTPVSLSCTAEGSPSPNITWIKSGVEIFEAINEAIIITNTVTGMMVESTLTINSTVVSDSSTYICVARNNAGSSNSTAVVLKVEAIPIFIHDAEPSVSVVLPTPVSLSCTAEGSPVPTITWIKSGVEIFEAINEAIIITNTVTGMMVESTLTINSTVESDSSTYICVARNNAGSSNSTAVVLTVVSLKVNYIEIIPFFVLLIFVMLTIFVILTYLTYKFTKVVEDKRLIGIHLGVHMMDGNQEGVSQELDLNKITVSKSIIHDEVSLFEVLLDSPSKTAEYNYDESGYYIAAEMPRLDQQTKTDSFSVNTEQHLSDPNTYSASIKMTGYQTSINKDSNETLYLETDSYNHDEISEIGIPIYTSSVSLASLSQTLPLPLDLDSPKFYPTMDDSYIQPYM